MIFLLRMGWRNVLRNKKRSFLSALAIGVGLAAVIISDAFMLGMIKNMEDEVTGVFLGEGQISSKEFRISGEVGDTLIQFDQLKAKLKNDSRVLFYSERSIVNAMISTPQDVVNVGAIGVDARSEKNISQVFQRIIKGDPAHFKGKGILIGKRLQERLDVRVGEKIVFTSVEAHSDEIVQELFRVSGIFDLGSKDMNLSVVFIPLDVSKKLLKISSGHQIVLKVKDKEIFYNKNHPFWAEYSIHGNEALSWKNISPGITNFIEMSSYSALIVAGILFLIVAFGIMNTLFMSIFDRLYEFGVLKAVGTNAFRIGCMVVSEAISLTAISILFGSIITLVFGSYLATKGIDYSGIEFETITFAKPILAIFNIKQFILYPGIICIFTICISIYPAIYAARLKPVDAMRKTL